MTPKEKATELTNKYCQVLFGDERFVNINNPKKCILILCDEIIESYKQFTGMYDQEFFDSQHDFWIEVKKEIAKL